jgi:hypothetical protein
MRKYVHGEWWDKESKLVNVEGEDDNFHMEHTGYTNEALETESYAKLL